MERHRKRPARVFRRDGEKRTHDTTRQDTSARPPLRRHPRRDKVPAAFFAGRTGWMDGPFLHAIGVFRVRNKGHGARSRNSNITVAGLDALSGFRILRT